MAEQSLAKHTRIDPMYHLVMQPMNLVLLVWSSISLYKHRDQIHILLSLLVLLVILTVIKTRLYALKNQDRLIRLEEQVRLHRLMPNEAALVDELTVDQMVGLRFASNAEAPELARRAVRENLSRKQIKHSIHIWRADNSRI